jgi:putative addiction module antidote
MIYETSVQKIGNELGIVLPSEVLDRMGAKEGETLYITQAPGKAVRMTSSQPGFVEKMQLAEECMRRYPNALRELAQ